MIQVSWLEAVAYCRWLTEEEGLGEEDQCYPESLDSDDGTAIQLHPDFRKRRGYRLPTPTEWEKACFADVETLYPFGYDVSVGANFATLRISEIPGTHMVGTKMPNQWGLFGTCGNVSEWCSGRGKKNNRPVRGPTNKHGFQNLRVGVKPNGRYFSVGFRIARSIVDEQPSPALTVETAAP